jgi:hypothetical protein
MKEGIELDLGNLDEERVREVFAHEVAHAMIERRSGGKLSQHRQRRLSRWFHEGLAKWIELRFAGQVLEESPVVQAATCSYDLRSLEFVDLVKNKTLVATRDQDLVYGLGALWMDQLVAAYGEEAPGEVLGALARDNSPTKVGPRSLWEDALQRSGYDIEEVLERWESRLEALASKCPELPSLTPTLERDGRTLVATLEPGDGLPRRCRLRTKKDAPPEKWRNRKPKDGVCRWKKLPKRAVEVQIQVVALLDGSPISGHWQTVPMK